MIAVPPPQQGMGINPLKLQAQALAAKESLPPGIQATPELIYLKQSIAELRMSRTVLEVQKRVLNRQALRGKVDSKLLNEVENGLNSLTDQIQVSEGLYTEELAKAPKFDTKKEAVGE